MAFPSQLAADDSDISTKDKILFAAFEEIHRVGFQAASLSQILEHTGVTKGALYHHFPSKIDLGYAVLDEVIYNMVYQTWVQPLTDGNPIDAMIDSIQQAGDEISLEDITLGCPLNNISQEMTPIDDGFRDRINKIYSDWRNGVIAALQRGQKEGYVSFDVNPVQMGTMLVAALEGCIGLAKSAQSKEVLMDCGHGVINILNSLRK